MKLPTKLYLQIKAVLQDYDMQTMFKESNFGRLNGIIQTLYLLDYLDGIRKYVDNDFSEFRKLVN